MLTSNTKYVEALFNNTINMIYHAALRWVVAIFIE